MGAGDVSAITQATDFAAQIRLLNLGMAGQGWGRVYDMVAKAICGVLRLR